MAKRDITIGSLDAVVDEVDTPKHERVVIFVHGIPGHMNTGHIRDASNAITEQGLATTVRYSMAQDKKAVENVKRSWIRNPLYLSWRNISTFSGTYQDAQQELGEVIRYVQTIYHPQRLYLSGHSYGAGLALLAAPEIPNIEGVIVSNPMVTLRGWRKMLGWDRRKGRFRKFPSEAEFIARIKKYEGPLRVVHSQQDKIVSSYNTRMVYDAAAPLSDDKSIIPIPGNDHDFVGKTPREGYIQAHLDFLRH